MVSSTVPWSYIILFFIFFYRFDPIFTAQTSTGIYFDLGRILAVVSWTDGNPQLFRLVGMLTDGASTDYVFLNHDFLFEVFYYFLAPF